MKQMATLRTYEKVIQCDMETPITIYNKYIGDGVGFLLESKEQPRGRYSFMGTNPDYTIRAYGDRIEVIMADGSIEETRGTALEIVNQYMGTYTIINKTNIPFIGGAVGNVGYDMIKQYEVIPDENPDPIGTPDLNLMFITELMAYDHHFQQLHLIVLEEADDDGAIRAKARLIEMERTLDKASGIEAIGHFEEMSFSSNVDQATYEAAVTKAKQYIYDGDIFQVVLSQRWSAECSIDPFTLYRRLRHVNPSPYMFYFNFGDYNIVGASPEMLVEMKDGRIKNCPIAGTRKRGADPEEDAALAADLLADEKECSEHNMLVDLGRNDMGKVAKIGSVEVTEYMQVHNYSHVMHLVSLVEGNKAEDQDMFSVLMSFLPAGTLSGAPKIRAMEIIDELEVNKRGIYGGAIGYFGFNGNMDMCIAIRTLVYKDHKVHIQAGAGIVADSDPTKEYEETMNKARALMTALKA